MTRPTGAFPPPAEPSVPASDPAAFRDALARVPAAVVVVATDGPAGLGGFTATAFTSVSDAPPTILVCLNRKSTQTEVFRTNGVFSVNLLPADGRPVADLFAGFTKTPAPLRFDPALWLRGAGGVPVLKSARVVLECRLSALTPVGSHHVLFGEVERVAIKPAAPEAAEILLYHDRGYRAI